MGRENVPLVTPCLETWRGSAAKYPDVKILQGAMLSGERRGEISEVSRKTGYVNLRNGEKRWREGWIRSMISSFHSPMRTATITVILVMVMIRRWWCKIHCSRTWICWKLQG